MKLNKVSWPCRGLLNNELANANNNLRSRRPVCWPGPRERKESIDKHKERLYLISFVATQIKHFVANWKTRVSSIRPIGSWSPPPRIQTVVYILYKSVLNGSKTMGSPPPNMDLVQTALSFVNALFLALFYSKAVQ